MPQFDVTSFPSQIFWLAVCFSVLYYLMSRTALPRIAAALAERQERIDEDLERAQHLKTQSEAAIQAYEGALSEARLQAHGVVKQSQEEIGRLTVSRNREVADRLAAEVKAGEARISAAKEVALAQVRDIAADVAEAATRHLTGLDVVGSRASDVVAAVVKERG